MTAGGLGLYLGHAAAWRHILSAGLDFGLVFEDDLTLFAPSLPRQRLRGPRRHRPADRPGGGALGPALPAEAQASEAGSGRMGPEDRARVGGDRSQGVAEARRRAARRQRHRALHGRLPALGGGGPEAAARRAAGELPAGRQLGHVPGLSRAAFTPPLAQCQDRSSRARSGGGTETPTCRPRAITPTSGSATWPR
ncbi:unnamed protein product [Prorocentrum cordatum]|uniref:Mannosyltransferase n=1 Tax=Prorocentrum cordatum TaxID=2364126 RepID=A0ABN9QN36_9DINO|nr:unnamed protein product [Polarella glacialis]